MASYSVNVWATAEATKAARSYSGLTLAEAKKQRANVERQIKDQTWAHSVTLDEDPVAYLSTSDGRWRVINGGVPCCKDTDEAGARACAARFKLTVAWIWYGNDAAWGKDLAAVANAVHRLQPARPRGEVPNAVRRIDNSLVTSPGSVYVDRILRPITDDGPTK